MLGRSRAELRETLGADEWNDWILMHGEYDLPDAYFLAALIGIWIHGLAGVNKTFRDVVPYYRAFSSPKRADNIKEAFAFFAAHATTQP